MLFKFSVIAAVAATFASAAVISVEQRQLAPPAACTFVVDPSPDTPDPTADLDTEFNYILGRNLADYVPTGTFIRNGNASVAGPDAQGIYTVAQTIAADALTTAEAIAVVTGWVGTTFAGPWSGVNWLVKSVTC